MPVTSSYTRRIPRDSSAMAIPEEWVHGVLDGLIAAHDFGTADTLHGVRRAPGSEQRASVTPVRLTGASDGRAMLQALTLGLKKLVDPSEVRRFRVPLDMIAITMSTHVLLPHLRLSGEAKPKGSRVRDDPRAQPCVVAYAADAVGREFSVRRLEDGLPETIQLPADLLMCRKIRAAILSLASIPPDLM